MNFIKQSYINIINNNDYNEDNKDTLNMIKRLGERLGERQGEKGCSFCFFCLFELHGALAL